MPTLWDQCALLPRIEHDAACPDAGTSGPPVTLAARTAHPQGMPPGATACCHQWIQHATDGAGRQGRACVICHRFEPYEELVMRAQLRASCPTCSTQLDDRDVVRGVQVCWRCGWRAD